LKQKYFREVFNFNKQDRHGLLLLFVFLIITIIFNLFVNFLFKKDSKNYDFSDFDEKVRKYKDAGKNSFANTREEKNITTKPSVLFFFNPNTISENDLVKLGMNTFQIQNLIKYREKGGIFYQPEDVRKIYGIDDNLFNKLKPYIKIELETIEYNNNNNDSEKIEIMELNSVKFTEFKKIDQISPLITQRIIKYRNLLGGFYSLTQLYEVYDIDTFTVELLTDCFYIDTTLIQKININNATYNELLDIPYLTKYHVDAIFNYKKNNKKFKSKKDLINYNLLDKNTFEKASHYIDLQ